MNKERNTMITSQSGRNLIKAFEGFVDHSYQDSVGIWTIGYGTTRVNGSPVQPGMTCTSAQAEQYLTADLAAAEHCVNSKTTQPLAQNQFDACVSLSYNIGCANFSGSTLLRMINAGDLDNAQPQFLRWNKAHSANGYVALKGLTRRRLAEAALFGPISADDLVSSYSLDV